MRNFLKQFATICIASFLSFAATAKDKKREYYELKVYHYTSASQEKAIDTYLQQALIPALHRSGVSSVGAFKAVANDTAAVKSFYVLVPFNSLEDMAGIQKKLDNDAAYASAGKEYIDAAYNQAPFTRFESILLHAFHLAPETSKPNLKGPKSERIYELRSYEGPTEKLYRKKVEMFNEGGEIDLFKRLNFNAVFYSEVIAGSRMPNLMYMTTFENMADRDAHWKSFSDDAFWKKLSAMPEYKNTVSKSDIIFLHPTEYSDY